jgi:DNA repair protein RadD
MPPRLRPYQQDLDNNVNTAFAAGMLDVLAVSPTGSGKTVFFAHKIRTHPGASVAIAHRQELVTQISVALARNEVRHRIIGSKAVTKNIVALHMADGGRSYYDANARCAAAGIDTLIRMDANDPFFQQITFGVLDEAHHVLRENKWGLGRKMLPNARFLHVTATPVRADGKGLGRHADGFIDQMVMAPTMRELINMGYLTDYRVICAESHIKLMESDISSTTGDFNQDKLRKAVHDAKITGDVVKTYLERAAGKLGVTFAVDVEHATEIAAGYRAAGIRAEVVSAKTPDALRMDLTRKFKRREILQLVNVDLFGEGYDLPALEVVSFARPTASWSLYCQQWGRVLRLMLDPSLYPLWDGFTDAERRAHIAASGKPYGLIIDHVGNTVRHNGPPDARTEFTLDRRERRSSGMSDAIPYRVCTNPNDGSGVPCAKPYERFYKTCPYCGFQPEPAARNAPEFVEGDLVELDPQILALMRGEIARIDGAARFPAGADHVTRLAINKRHVERQEAQAALRQAMSWWAGLQDALGHADTAEKQRLFYLTFGVDVATAQAFNVADAGKLRDRICDKLQKYGIDGTIHHV